MTDAKYYRIVYIYARGGKVRCFSPDDMSREKEQELKETGWKHTVTIDAKLWIEALLNDAFDITKELHEMRHGITND